jgi:hypothetical protein
VTGREVTRNGDRLKRSMGSVLVAATMRGRNLREDDLWPSALKNRLKRPNGNQATLADAARVRMTPSGLNRRPGALGTATVSGAV